MGLALCDKSLDAVKPANITLDRTGRIIRVGPSLIFHIKCDPVGRKLTEFFDVSAYEGERSQKKEGSARQLQLKGRAEADGLFLRGPAIPSGGKLYILGGHIPVIANSDDRRELRFEDFATTDSAMDMHIVSKLYLSLMEEAKQLSREVTEKRIQAEAASVAKSQFLSTMSHELRTPLNGILGMAQVLGTRELCETNRGMIDVILSSGEALLAILNDVLDITRIEAGGLTIDPQDEDFVAAMIQIANLHKVSAEKKSLSFELTVDENFPVLARIDTLRAGQCVSNLISNAIKFTHQGCVKVDVTHKDVSDAYVFSVSVADTGVGIHEDVQGSLFEPFTQADSSTTRDYGGSGLGLSICVRLAELMGGGVTVKSELGAGSTFTVTFKADKVQVCEGRQSAA